MLEQEELMELKNKLTNGMVFKSYRALCENMGLKKGEGNTRRANMKKLDAICTYHKQGNSIVIDEVFDAPLLIEDNRKGKQPSNFSQFKVDEDKWYNKGVYMIKLDNQVYIGSTVNFRGRFIEHRNYKGVMKHTQELLKQGGEFFILHDMNDIEDIELIRQIEEEYILFYTHETDYDVVNRRMNTSAFEKPKKSEKPKIKYKSIKIEENRLSEVLEILEERGVHYEYR